MSLPASTVPYLLVHHLRLPEEIEYEDDGVDEMDDDGGDAVEAARRTLFDTDRKIVSLVLNGHRVLVQH